jgi:phosphonate transport system ATP-binding protein
MVVRVDWGLPRSFGDLAAPGHRSYRPATRQQTAVHFKLILDNVGVVYPGGTVALRGVSLTFEPGQLCAVIGPSGAGKSTLLRCLNLLVRPTSGSVATGDNASVEGRAAIRAHRARTGFVFQQHQLLQRQCVLANVMLARLSFHGSLRSLFPLPAEDRVMALRGLERVGLLDRAMERVSRLSGGQQQRVGIARALTQAPQVMLADEPVASLDPASARSVLSLLQRICREDGIPTVVNLHQVGYAREFADRVVGLSAGRVVFDGPPQALTDPILDEIYGLTPGAPELTHKGRATPARRTVDPTSTPAPAKTPAIVD